ncbi:MAG: hypothetical protein LBJ46_11065 [Planctomycetota bacterium]|nr:hypothetical protein [Planctomycetota bacterium]
MFFWAGACNEKRRAAAGVEEQVEYDLEQLMDQIEAELSQRQLMKAKRLVRAEKVKWGLE